MNLTRQENIILLVYLGFVILTGISRFQIENYLRFFTVFLFLVAFLPAFLGYTSPIGNSFQNWRFSLAWIIISVILILIFRTLLKEVQIYSRIVLAKFSIIPALGFFYFHLIRFGFKLLLRREPIVANVGYAAVSDTIFKGQKANLYDRLFTAISFFGIMFFIIWLMSQDKWFWEFLQ